MHKKIRLGRMISASSEESADIFYAGGFNAPDEFLYFETPEEKGIIVSPLEFSRAVLEAKKNVRVINRAELLRKLPKTDAQKGIYRLLTEQYEIDKWLVPNRFPLACADAIRSDGIVLETVSGDFFPERRRKNRSEIAAIRKSMKATEEAMETVRDILVSAKVNSRGQLVFAGKILTSDFIRTEIETLFKRKSFSAFRTILASGPDSAAPHNIGSGPILAGTPVVSDIFPRSDTTGYWGDMTRTFVKGRAPTVVRKAFEAVRQASEEAMKVLRPGVTGAEVHQAAVRSLDAAGFHTGHDKQGRPCGFFHGLGHGVGLEIHEQPRLSPQNPNPLEPGNVVSVEPGLYYPEWGGIRLEDLVVLTKDSFENFCTMPKELEIP